MAENRKVKQILEIKVHSRREMGRMLTMEDSTEPIGSHRDKTMDETRS